MSWIFLALLAPLFWAGSNIFDKYALTKISRGNYDFLFFGTIGSFIIVILTFTTFGLENFTRIAFLSIIAGFFLQYSYLFYSHALQKEDASYITPLYISYAVVVLILSPLFGEVVTTHQFVSFLIVFVGVVILSLKKLSLEIFKYRKAALLMLPAILFISLYVLFLNKSLELLSFTDAFIYNMIGFTLSAFSLLLVPNWRKEILNGLKTANIRKFSLFLINDTLDMSGHLIYLFALTVAPSVSLVAVLGGIQPFYVLILGALFTIFMPSIVKENISKREVAQKLIGTLIIVIGIIVLNLYN